MMSITPFFCVSKKNSSPPRGRACAFFLFPLDFFRFGHNPEPHLFPAPDCISFREMHMFIWRGFWGSWNGERLRERVRACMCVCMCWSKFPLPSLVVVVLVLLPCLPEFQFGYYEQIGHCPLNLNPNLKVTKWVYVVDDIQTFLHSNLVLEFAHLQ